MYQSSPEPAEAFHTMEAQLRQDFLYMQIRNLPPLHLTLDSINRFYRFSFPQGTFCVFVLGAASKVHGAPIQHQWMLAADQYVHEQLGDLEGDFETLILGPKLYCLIGSALPRETLTARLRAMFEGLRQLKTTYTCAWTMGLGRYVGSFSDISETLFSAQHAIKYSIRDGIEQFYDGNTDCTIYEGGLTITTPSEQLALKRLIQEPDSEAVQHGIRSLFREKHEQIERYPVFAYMLALQIINITLQTLREIMPVDRKTYELSQQIEDRIDDLATLEALIGHTVSGAQALCQRYQMFLSNGKSQPLWLVITYIQEHYTEHITLAELSRVTDRNPQYISAVFSKACGMSLKEYITSLRIEEAKRLLRATSSPISTIALKTGYQDAKYFSRMFQKHTGQTPRDYRASAEQK